MERDIIDIISRYEVRGSKYGLERTRALLDAFGSPDEKLKIIHIAGSNGKGSIAEYVTRILLAAGRTVGTFTSPAVCCYAEKFAVNGDLPDLRRLRQCLSEVYDRAMTFYDRPTAFEIETVAALCLFVKCGVEYAVVECGLGGRYDATNAISRKQVAVISSVSKEHTALLGNTITEICRHKAGIIKDCPAVVSALQSEEGREYFSSLGVTFADGVEDIRPAEGGQFFTFRGNRYFIPLFGSAQCYNAALAVLACKVIGVEGECVARGLASAHIFGRMEIIRRGGRTFVLDGAHNPAAFSPLVEYASAAEGSKSLVFSCLSDKDVGEAAKILGGLFDEVIIFPSPSYRKMSLDAIYAAFSKYNDNIIRADDTADALASAGCETVVLCGTFTVISEGRKWIDREQ